MMTKREIQIDPSLDLQTTKIKAQKIAARALKKGLSGGYTITTELRQETNSQGVTFEQAYLIIEGEPAKFNGYTFVAVVEWVGGQPVVTGSPYYSGKPVDRSLLIEGACDDCGVNRDRKAVVIVEDENGDRLQVGKQCLKDYLGNFLSASWFNTQDVFEEFEGYGGSGKEFKNLLKTLAVASSIIRQRGWVSKSSAQINDKVSTASLVQLVSYPRPGGKEDGKEWDALRNGFDEVADNEFAIAALQFGKSLEAGSDYVANLQAVIAQDAFDSKFFGLVVSLVGVYKNSLDKKAEEAADAVIEEEFGQVGEKVTVTLKVVSVNSFESAYGVNFVNTFTGEGRRFKWITGYGFEQGQTVTLKGTIKKYDEYNGKLFTVLTRCKEVAA